MSSNDPSAEKKDPESQARASVAPASTRPLAPSERRAASMPPPPPRRSVKPSGPPPPPPRPPRGQRLAGIFSAPPPPLTQAEPLAQAPPAVASATPEPVVAVPAAAEAVVEPVVAQTVAESVVAVPVAAEAAAEPVVAVPVAAEAAAEPVVAVPVATEAVAEPVVAVPVATEAVAEPVVAVPVATEAAAELPVAEPASAPAQPAFAEPAVEPPSPELEAPPLAALQGDSSLPAVVPASSSLPLTPSSSRLSPLPSSLSLPPPPATLGARLVSSVPPHWVEVARQHPALWMVGVPVVLASLLILVLLVLEPAAKPVSAKPAASAAAAPALVEAAPVTAPAPAAPAQPDTAALAALEGKAPDSLSVAELLLLNEAHAGKKRDEARALSLKLQQQPDLAKDEAMQAQLLRLAADPASADTALGAMAQAQTPVGPDLLYEVWTSRSSLASTAELARVLLYSRDVRSQVSPALAAALELRTADSCEAVQAALPKALSDGDRRSLAPLAKLNSRRACGAKSSGDCNPCVRGPIKPVVAAVAAVRGRRAPNYPTR